MNFDVFLFSTLLLLITVSLTVGISKKLGLGSILGLLTAGVIVGPYSPGPALTSEVDSLRHFAEIGVVLLLFLIGLEMKPKKLWSLRRDVFGFGSLQILISGLIIGGYTWWSTSISGSVALLIGFTLALSSTAFVIQILQERGEIASRYGRTSFAILLMQDIAVVPLLAILPLLSEQSTLANTTSLWAQLSFVLFMIVAMIGFGKYVVPKLLSYFARERNNEAFVFTVLLSVVFAAWAMEHAGLSMALGAFLMGMTLSESKYSLQIEANIEPYKGMLMSLFFVAVGMSLDLNVVAAQPWYIAQHVFLIMLIKIVVIFVLALIFGHTRENAFRMAFLLAQSGEFGFVLFGAAITLGVINDTIFAIGIAVISISMFLTPFYIKLGEIFAHRASGSGESDTMSIISNEEHHAAIIIAGFGRVGTVVAASLSTARSLISPMISIMTPW